MSEDDPKTFLSKKLSDGAKDPEQITNLESKEQREYYRFLTAYGNISDPRNADNKFDFLISMRDYEQRMNMSKEKMRPEQLVEAIVGLEESEKKKTGARELAEELKKERK